MALVLEVSRFKIRYWNFRCSTVEWKLRKLIVGGISSAPVHKEIPRGINEIGFLSCTENTAVSQKADYYNKRRIWRLGGQ